MRINFNLPKKYVLWLQGAHVVVVINKIESEHNEKYRSKKWSWAYLHEAVNTIAFLDK